MDLPFNVHSQRTKQRKIRQTVDHLLVLNTSVVGGNDLDPQTDHVENTEFDASNIAQSTHLMDVAKDTTGKHGTDDSSSSSSAEEFLLSDSADPRASEADDRQSLKEDICGWAVKHNISQAALSDLLGVLRQNDMDLPRDPRSVMGTPRSVDIKQIAGGQYHYFGVAKAIQSIVNQPEKMKGCVLTLAVNVDGLPLFKSSGESLWPVLGKLKEDPDNQVFVIALYSGKGKPSSLTEYLEDFLNEMEAVLEHGVDAAGKHFNVCIGAFICDAPARAFLKCIKGHTAYHGCEKCCSEGQHVNGRMTFPDLDASVRTDCDFSSMIDEDHHHHRSPLLRLGIGMVTQFPLDYMHLICLGVMKKLIELWKKGPLSGRLHHQRIADISDTLVSLRRHIPREFARKPRSLEEFRRWKATEFRQFLLYTGPVVLQEQLSGRQYRNFMLFAVACMILANDQFCTQHPEYVRDLLKTFVRNFADIYGQEYLVYNVHSLVHIVDDVQVFGPLDAFSAFPFENYMQKLKKMVRRPQDPVAQIVRRVKEEDGVVFSEGATSTCQTLGSGTKTDSEQVTDRQSTRCSRWYLSTSEPDNCVGVGDKVGLVRSVVGSSYENPALCVEFFDNYSNFFTYPLDSMTLGIQLVENLMGNVQTIHFDDVTTKMMLLPYKNAYVSYPLLHG